MEKIRKGTLVLTTLLSCNLLLAQGGQIGEIVQIHFPPGTVKLSKEELRAIVADKNDSLTRQIHVDANGQYFIIDSLLLTLNGRQKNVSADFLESWEKWIKRFCNKEDGGCNSVTELKKINNYRVLLTNVESEQWDSYFFFSVNKTNSAVLTGRIRYGRANHKEKAKARKIIEEVLKNTVFN